jgi:hypothetical protein
MPVQWRRWNKILHRDIGYTSVALLLVYGISGLAVNHMADWNPNYTRERTIVRSEPFAGKTKEEIIAEAKSKLHLTSDPQNYFRADSSTAQLFFGKITYSIDLPTGTVLIESMPPRRVLFEMNQLHLNAVKGGWTYVADLFALSLILIGITGLFMVKGANGIGGRGKWFVAGGTAVPLLYWAWYLLV